MKRAETIKGQLGLPHVFFIEYRQHQPPRSEKGIKVDPSWKAPPPKYIKLNYDGALKANDSFGVRAMEFGIQMGFTKIIIQGDALSVVSKINQPTPHLSPIGNLIEDAKKAMQGFQCCKVQHVKRQANHTAHELTISTLSITHDVYWVDECPHFILPLPEHDCMYLET
ncbi:hypothetical protein CRYUN_Cryun09bG0222900 [Craigia yunnanensis]